MSFEVKRPTSVAEVNALSQEAAQRARWPASSATRRGRWFRSTSKAIPVPQSSMRPRRWSSTDTGENFRLVRQRVGLFQSHGGIGAQGRLSVLKRESICAAISLVTGAYWALHAHRRRAAHAGPAALRNAGLQSGAARISFSLLRVLWHCHQPDRRVDRQPRWVCGSPCSAVWPCRSSPWGFSPG